MSSITEKEKKEFRSRVNELVHEYNDGTCEGIFEFVEVLHKLADDLDDEACETMNFLSVN